MMPPAGGAARGQALGAIAEPRARAARRARARRAAGRRERRRPAARPRRAPRLRGRAPRARRARRRDGARRLARLRGLAAGARGQRLRGLRARAAAQRRARSRATPRASPRPSTPTTRCSTATSPARRPRRSARSSRRCATGSCRCSPRSPRSPRRRRCAAASRSPRSARSASRSSHAMGFDESAWRLDDAVHPFAASPSSHDVRVTSRFDDESLTGLFALMHEVGHGLYEHGIDPALARTTLDTRRLARRPRVAEPPVGEPRRPQRAVLEPLAPAPARRRCRRRSRASTCDDFLRGDQRRAPDAHPRRGRRADLLAARHPALRARARADRGHARPADLPRRGRQKLREMLGIEVPDDLRGVLQDIHWSEGIIGYFPTYAIGNVLAAQLWRVARADLPGLDDDIRAGRLRRPARVARREDPPPRPPPDAAASSSSRPSAARWTRRRCSST